MRSCGPLLAFCFWVAVGAAEHFSNDQIPIGAGFRTLNETYQEKLLQDATLPDVSSSFWLELIKHEGTSPFLDNADWKVFRNVKDYGAKGDGENDDTQSIQNAIDDGNRRNSPHGTTNAPALLYIPAGTYKVSGTLQLWLQTSVVGNPLNLPVIKPTDALGGNYVWNGNDYSTQSTNNFYISIRNIKIDTTDMDKNTQVKAINWGVSQATSLTNVEIVMPFGPNQHTGIVMNGRAGDFSGSNTMFGDISITGGNIGIAVSGQQLLLKSINFWGCTTAIQVEGFQLLVLQAMHFDTCGTCVEDLNGASAGLYLIDSVASNVGTVLSATDTTDGAGSILVENLSTNNPNSKSIVLDGQTRVTGNVKTWAHGNVFFDNSDDPTKNHVQRGIDLPTTNRPSALLDSNGNVFVKKMPQYETYDVSQFGSVKSFGAKGDGHNDDTQAIISALNSNAGHKITYFPHGVYLVSSTITIPPGSRLVGEVWSVISGSGGFFGDENNPKPVVQIGGPGSTGVVEITDILFTIADILPGAILLEVNMAGANQGDVSLHNTHFRIGGATDSNVNNVCSTSPSQCKAGFLLLHVTKNSSCYFEDVWGWTADHALEGGSQGDGHSNYISTGRGFLIESQKATWMMGVAPEHQTLYGFNIVSAQNLYIAMAQVETPYWQPTPPSSPATQAPAPWTVNNAYSDPNFGNCASHSDVDCFKAWGMRIVGGTNILAYGIGTWTFFEDFDGNWGGHADDCSKQANRYCQENAYEILENPKSTYLYGLATKKVQNMVVGAGTPGEMVVMARENENPAGWGGHIVAYLGFAGS